MAQPPGVNSGQLRPRSERLGMRFGARVLRVRVVLRDTCGWDEIRRGGRPWATAALRWPQSVPWVSYMGVLVCKYDACRRAYGERSENPSPSKY